MNLEIYPYKIPGATKIITPGGSQYLKIEGPWRFIHHLRKIPPMMSSKTRIPL